jgi:hypothetical protein
MTMRTRSIRQRAIGATGRSEFAVSQTFVAHVFVVPETPSPQIKNRRARGVQLDEQIKPVSFVVVSMSWGFEQVG